MEIMTVLAIISIVSSVVLPAIDNYYAGQRVGAMSQRLVQDIRLARYKALKDQSPHRLIFSPDYLNYKVQAYRRDDEDGNNDILISSVSAVAAEVEDYESDQWKSILSEEEVDIDPGLELIRDSGSPFRRCIFFWPDGTLVTRSDPSGLLVESNVFPLGENYLVFSYGNAAIRINVGAFGVMSSESYSAPEDDDFEDETDVAW